jgi:valyl-tRNA synthetase
MVSSWPIMSAEDLTAHEQSIVTHAGRLAHFQSLQAIVRAVRNARAEYKVEAGKSIAAIIKIADPALCNAMKEERAVISLLGRIDDRSLSVDLTAEADASKMTTRYEDLVGDRSHVHLIVQEGVEVFLPLSALVDAEKEMQRLRKQGKHCSPSSSATATAVDLTASLCYQRHRGEAAQRCLIVGSTIAGTRIRGESACQHRRRCAE